MAPDLFLEPRARLGAHAIAHALASKRALAVLTGPQLHLLDAEARTHLATVTLHGPADGVAFDPTAQFIVVGDRLGHLTFISLATQEPLLAVAVSDLVPKSVANSITEGLAAATKTATFFQGMAFLGAAAGPHDLAMVVLDRYLLRVRHLDLPALEAALDAKDGARAQALRTALHVEALDLTKAIPGLPVSQVRDLVAVPTNTDQVDRSPPSELLLLANGPAAIVGFGAPEDDSEDPSGQSSVTQVTRHMARHHLPVAHQPVPLTSLTFHAAGRLMLLRDTIGHLTLFDTDTLLVLRHHPDALVVDCVPVSAATLTPGPITRTAISVMAAALINTGDPSSSPGGELRLVNLVDGSTSFAQRAPARAQLISSTGDGAAGIFLALTTPHAEEVIQLAALTTTAPEQQLFRLLQASRYLEALAFAERQDLDPSPVHEAELATFLAQAVAHLQIHPPPDWAPAYCNPPTVTALLRTLADRLPVAILADRLDCIGDAVEAARRARHWPMPDDASTLYLLQRTQKRLERQLALIADANDDEETAYASAQTDLMTVRAGVRADMYRLGTWRLLHDGPLDLHRFHPDHWQHFRTADMGDAVKSYLAQGYVDSALTLWRRHAGAPGETSRGLAEYFIPVLTAVPPEFPVDRLTTWLRQDLIPDLRSSIQRQALAHWVEERARLLELRDRAPHRALDLIKVLSHDGVDLPAAVALTPSAFLDHTLARLAGPGNTDTADGLGDMSGRSVNPGGSCDTVVSTLGTSGTLSEQLADLCHLWDEHGLRIRLTDYAARSPATVALDLLERVSAPHLLPEAITEHLLPYAARHGLDREELLTEYCLNVLDQPAATLAGASWEARVLVALPYLRRPDSRLTVGLELMRRTPIPWSPEVDALIRDLLRRFRDRRHGAELREQFRLMRLRRMLLRYGVKVFNVSNLALAKGLVRYITSQVNEPRALADALRVVRAYHHLRPLDACAHRLQALVEHGVEAQLPAALQEIITGKQGVDCEVSDSDDQLDSHDPNQSEADEDDGVRVRRAAFVTHQVLAWLQDQLDKLAGIGSPQGSTETGINGQPQDPDGLYRRYVAMGLAIARALPTLVPPTVKSDDAPLRLDALEAAVDQLTVLKSVHTTYGHRLRPADIRDETGRLATACYLLTTQIGASPTTGNQGPIAGDRFPREVPRLAQALGCNLSTLRATVAEHAAARGIWTAADTLCRDLLAAGPSDATAEALRRVARAAAARLAEHADAAALPTALRLTECLREAVATVPDAVLTDALDECTAWLTLADIGRHTEHGDYQRLTRPTPMGTLESTTVIRPSTEASRSFRSSASGGQASCSFGFAAAGSMSILPVSAANVAPVPANLIDPTPLTLEAFRDEFVEQGLVLDTVESLTLAFRYIHAWGAEIDPVAVKAIMAHPGKGKGKGKGRAADSGQVAYVPESLRALRTHLAQHRHLGLCVALFQQDLGHRVYEPARAAGQFARLGTMGPPLTFTSPGDLLPDPHDLHNTVAQLFPHLARAPRLDLPLALAYLVLLPLETGHAHFRQSVQHTADDFSRAERFAAMGVAYALLWRQRAILVSCQELAANARWWHQLQLLRISFDRRLFSSNVTDLERRHVHLVGLLGPLLRRTGLDLDTALEFARAYQLEDDAALTEYVRVLLLTPDTPTTDTDDLRSRFAVAAHQVTRTDRLADQLADEVLPRLSSYSYERIYLALEFVRTARDDEYARRGLIVLDTLYSYGRRSLPSAAELAADRARVQAAAAEANDPEGATPESDQRSAKRLPFHMLMAHPWEVLRPELHESTVPRLLPLAIPLGLAPDDVYTHLAQDLLARLARHYPVPAMVANDPDPADEDSGPAPTFHDIKAVVVKIRNPEVAISVAKAAADALPCGPERLQALRTAYQLSERVLHRHTAREATHESSPEAERARAAVANLRGYYLATDTECQLLDHGLGQYAELVAEPIRLLETLYVEQGSAAWQTGGRPDVHSLAADVAARHNLDIDKVRDHLLTTWLLEPLAVDTVDLLPSAHLQLSLLGRVDPAERARQRRILYILAAFSPASGVHRLLEFAYKGRSRCTALHRVRALSVLFQHASPALIAAAQDVQQVRDYLRTLLYLADFEHLRIPQSVEDFHASRKSALARTVWLGYHAEPKAAQLVGNICLDFEVYDPTLMENVLQRLLAHQMLTYLVRILPAVGAIPALAALPCLPQLWADVCQGLLSRSQTEVDSDGSLSPAMETLDAGLAFALRCPMLDRLPVAHFLRILDRGRPVSWLLQAAAVLPTDAEADRVVQTRLDQLNPAALVELLGTTATATNYSLASPDRVKALIYDAVDRTRAYVHIAATPYVSAFVRHLVRGDRLAALMAFTLQEARIDPARRRTALDLVQLYYAHHGPDSHLDALQKCQPDHPLTSLDNDDGDLDLTEDELLDLFVTVQEVTVTAT
ncbi:hypothetical protein IWQ60_001182 [Tieghemiomyces parasiticus]|uniref:RZZ complex subunit KNTC1/ROD C-terminal domain-containing protein n=1 Tax=Tieghemiomyces parasiticus TaxID=78921 RepID=A0A9W8E2S6_9FUNG|nr:hypothetical protein IWQ60_001182 [Tieghemiomyces parasiticus]